MPPPDHPVPAEVGDLAALELAPGRWVLGEVVKVTKTTGRAQLLRHASGEEHTVSTKQPIRVAALAKMNKQRALRLWREAPERFLTWQDASRYVDEAKLQEGEDSGDVTQD